MQLTVRNPFLAAALVLAATAMTARAQDANTNPPPPSGGYQIGEPDDSVTDADSGDQDQSQDNQGPVRLACFSYVHGDVIWRASDQDGWAPATDNLPIRQGADIYVATGRAEIQFDDGSVVRLGHRTMVTLDTLYSDSQGEYTILKLTEGLSTLNLRTQASQYQVDTPFASVTASGPANIRIGAGDSVEVAVRDGSATVENGAGSFDMAAGSYDDIPDSQTSGQVTGLPSPDGFDRWNDQREGNYQDAQTDSYLPPDIALVAGNLNGNGTWYDDPQYGWIWAPTVTDPGWRPYMHGHWVWVVPFGWTWVSDESWGWAPYHYGTWVQSSYGWAWVPGPATQYWCPGVVHFVTQNGIVAWAPLAPEEVRYPATIRIGFGGGNWSAFFSIGGAAYYYPSTSSYCEPHPWFNREVNRTTYINQTTIINNTTIFNNTTVVNNRFVPRNARLGATITATTTQFGGGGSYTTASDGAGIFQHGQAFGPSGGRGSHSFGPSNVHPTQLAFTPLRGVAPPTTPPDTIQRNVFRGHAPTTVQQFHPLTGSVPSAGGFGGVRNPAPQSPTGTSGSPGRHFRGTAVSQPSMGQGGWQGQPSMGNTPTTGGQNGTRPWGGSQGQPSTGNNPPTGNQDGTRPWGGGTQGQPPSGNNPTTGNPYGTHTFAGAQGQPSPGTNPPRKSQPKRPSKPKDNNNSTQTNANPYSTH